MLQKDTACVQAGGQPQGRFFYAPSIGSCRLKKTPFCSASKAYYATRSNTICTTLGCPAFDA